MAYVSGKTPQVVLCENVRGILKYADYVLGKFRESGYACGYRTLSAADFLLPQSRPRVWFFAELAGGEGVADVELSWRRLVDNMRSGSQRYSLAELRRQP